MPRLPPKGASACSAGVRTRLIFGVPYQVRAKVRHQTWSALAVRRAQAAPLKVAPVVHTSSTTMTLFGGVAPGSTEMRPSRFARR